MRTIIHELTIDMLRHQIRTLMIPCPDDVTCVLSVFLQTAARVIHHRDDGGECVREKDGETVGTNTAVCLDWMGRKRDPSLSLPPAVTQIRTNTPKKVEERRRGGEGE